MKVDLEKGISELQNKYQKDINYKLPTDVESYYLKYLSIHPEYYCKKNNIEIFQKNLYKVYYKLISLDPNQNPDEYYSLSCIFGAFIADYLGSFCEFSSKSDKNHKRINDEMNVFGLPKGNVTDDSEMGMSLAYAILSTSDIELDEDILYFFYGLWYYSGPFDMGYTTRTALRYFDIKNSDINSKGIFKKAFDIFKVSISDSKANGFLMRIN